MTVEDKDKIEQFTLQDIELVVGRCHGEPFCVHLLQEEDNFYFEDGEIILNCREVQNLVDAFPGMNAVKDKHPRNYEYTGKYSFVKWHVKNGWTLGERLNVCIQYDTFRIIFEMYRQDENDFQTCIQFGKRDLRAMHKIFLKLLSTNGSPAP